MLVLRCPRFLAPFPHAALAAAHLARHAGTGAVIAWPAVGEAIAMPRWLGILSRCVAAILGGYGLAALFAIACSFWLPASRSEAVLTGMLGSIAIFAGAVIWVFSVQSAWRAWAGLALPAALLGAALYLTGAWA